MRQTDLAADTAARAAALTALDRTMLVEAGAGSGKTSVLAGRVAMLLASGVPPRSLAAITFTELAAGELRARVVAFVGELATGFVRPDLAAAFDPNGPTPSQLGHLQAAQAVLDELTCTTIHGFCQRLLRPYPAEAGMDPGAAVMDRDDAEALRDEVLDDWLRERLSGTAQPDDLLAALFLRDAPATDGLIRNALRWMAYHRGANVTVVPRANPLAALRDAAMALRAFLDGTACREPETVAIAAELEALLAAVDPNGPEAAVLLHASALRAPKSCAKVDGDWKKNYQKKGKWEAAAKGVISKSAANALNDAASAIYEDCRTAHDEAHAYTAGRILHRLAGELRTVLARFAERKRDAALVDFDDLLVGARDLLADRPAVRDTLATRYRTVLVDEFQDTDPLQCEILWRLCADQPDPARPWQDWPLRPGALFLVGDPKQAIYRFRGADVATYTTARDHLRQAPALARVSIVTIGQNFRSTAVILDWVNTTFEARFTDQPGFARLFTTTTAAGQMAVATLPVDPATGVNERRDAEAEAVAKFCARVIGALLVRDGTSTRACRPDDIALLAPAGTDLWRYERALEDAGIAVSTQAGKGFFRRQEIQDLLALTRTLADGSDTLALGALLRGPLVGLTEEILLDATGTLPPRENGTFATLSLWTPLDQIAQPLLRDTLAILQALARSVRHLVPFVLLSQAVEELQVRALLRQRHDRTAERALANVDQFLEAARAYDVRGLVAFAHAMTAQWKDARRTMEGRPDTEQQAVTLMTMHAAKGLEWPVVVPINMGGEPGDKIEAALDADRRLHLRVFGREPHGTAAALATERQEVERQWHRLWYVGATRARDLLLLPAFEDGAPAKSWQHHIGLDYASLDPFDAEELPDAVLHRMEDAANDQDLVRFAQEAGLIAGRTHRLRRVTPHLAEDGEKLPASPPLPPVADDPASPVFRPRGSQARGLLLHKLLEEVLTGETGEDELVERGLTLLGQLDAPGVATVDGTEIADTVRRALQLPEIRAVRARLVPECSVAASRTIDDEEALTFGVADALTLDATGAPELVIDWKSDVDPSDTTVRHYHAQLRAYLCATGAKAGLLVFLTGGRVEPVTAALEENG